jgi:hypothetical protein
MEESKTILVDLSVLTPEQLQNELNRRNAEIALQKANKLKAYEALREQTITSLCDQAITISKLLKSFKESAFDDMKALYEMLKEYSSRHADGKGNFRIESGNNRITYKRQGKPYFDERSIQAERHIIDFVNSKFENDVDTKDLVMSLLERKKGELDINLVQKLYAMEDRFEDENWKKGIELLKESYTYVFSKDYIAFELRNENGEWESINLQFSNI